MKREAVCSREASAEDLARAQKLNLPLVDDSSGSEFCLVREGPAWGIIARSLPQMKPLVVDFTQGEWLRRRRELRKGGDILSKALAKVHGRNAVDATAGLGRDTLHLLALGFTVVAVEESPLLVFLLEAARAQAVASEGPDSELHRLTIIAGDARAYMRQLTTESRPDVIFLDPMFPSSGKTALAGKEMQILQQLVAFAPERDEDLLRAALQVCRDRVIVKRPTLAPPLVPEPRHQYEGKAVRYDVYFP